MTTILLLAVLSGNLCGRTTKPVPVFEPNETMTFDVRLEGFAGEDKSALFLKWKRSGDDGKTENGRVTMAEPFVYRTSLDRPGFVRLEGTLVDADDKPVQVEKNGRKQTVNCDLGAGAAVDRIRPAVPAPADFDAFWQVHREKLAKENWRGREQVEELPSPLEEVRLFKVKVPCIPSIDVTGYLAIPKKPGKHPACASFPGYGASFNAGNRQPPSAKALERNARNRLFFAVSPHGFELGREDAYYKAFRASLRSNGKAHGFDPIQNSDPEKTYYCSMSYRVLRALDYLKSRDEWNGKDLRVTGGSQGGLLSIWCAALDPAVTVCDVFIPWNCDIGGTELGRNRGDWYVKWVPALGYYDPCSMGPRIPKTCRVVISMAGLGDYISPPTGVMAFYNSVTAPKSVRFVQNAQHGNTLQPHPQVLQFRDDRLIDGERKAAPAQQVKVSDFGYDREDSTRFLQAAFDSGAKKVVIDRQAADWITRPLFLTNSNIEVVLEDGVSLVAKRGEFHGLGDSLVYIGRGAENVTLRGEGKATLRMHKADYLNPALHYRFSGGHRMTVNILSSRGATVRNLTILSSGGDGVYVGGGARDVLLEDLDCRDHKRQGISITGTERCTIRRCHFDETLGTPPTAGVDIEPNRWSDKASEILFEDCTFNRNGSHGIDLYLGALTARTKPVSVVFRRCVARDNLCNGITLMAGSPKYIAECGAVKGTILFEDCLLANNKQEPLKIINHTVAGLDVRFRNCCFDGRGLKSTAALYFSNGQLPKDFGGLTFENCRVIVDSDSPICDFEAQTGIGIGGRLEGVLAVTRDGRPETCDLGAFALRHAPKPELVSVFRCPATDYRTLQAPRGPVRGISTPEIRGNFVFVQTIPAAGEYKIHFKSRKLRQGADNSPCGIVQLLDEAGTDLGKFPIPVGDFDYVLRTRGPNVYRFEVSRKNESTIAVSSATPGGTLAANNKIKLFGGSNVNFHFRVPAAAQDVWADINPEEPASAELLDATGRKVAEAPYQRKSSYFRIKRKPTAEDEIWTLRFPKIQEDMGFQVGGDAMPLLATEREGVPGERKKGKNK